MALPQTPALTTDCVIFDPVGRVPLIRRKHERSAGSHVLRADLVWKLRQPSTNTLRQPNPIQRSSHGLESCRRRLEEDEVKGISWKARFKSVTAMPRTKLGGKSTTRIDPRL